MAQSILDVIGLGQEACTLNYLCESISTKADKFTSVLCPTHICYLESFKRQILPIDARIQSRNDTIHSLSGECIFDLIW